MLFTNVNKHVVFPISFLNYAFFASFTDIYLIAVYINIALENYILLLASFTKMFTLHFNI